MFECGTAHRRSVTVLCMLYKIKCNSMHSPYGGKTVPYVPVLLHMVFWSHIGILMRLLAADIHSPPVSLWNDLADPDSMVYN